MAARQPNLKINIGSDTSNFTKGMSTVKKELGAFEKTAGDIFSQVGQAFGINTQQVEKLATAFSGLTRKIALMGKEGTDAMKQMAAAVNGVTVAVAAIGIGAAVTAFKTLNEEATAFKNTVQGANIELQTTAYLETYRQAIHDYNESVGKGMAETEAKAKETWGRIFQNIKTGMVTAITQPVFSGTSTLVSTVTNAWNETAKAAEYATKKAEDAKPIAAQIYDLERKRVKQSEELAKINADIAEYQNIARDATNSVAERQNAMAEIQRLITEKEAMTVSLEQELAVLYQENSNLASDSIEAENALYAQKVKAYEAERAITTERTSLLKLQKQINTAAAAETKERLATLAAIEKGVQRLQEYATSQVEMFVSEDSVNAIQTKLGEALATKPIQVPVGIDLKPVEQQVLDLTETIQATLVEAVEGISEAIGNLVGNLINGEGGMEEFGKDILTMFGTFAQKFGKVLVAFGVAAEAARHTIANPLAAIAAGAALIAVGAAVKAVASNMATAMGGAAATSSYVASGASGGGYGYSDRTLTVEVTGTLTANGSQLVAVLNNENNRKQYTT